MEKKKQSSQSSGDVTTAAKSTTADSLRSVKLGQVEIENRMESVEKSLSKILIDLETLTDMEAIVRKLRSRLGI